MFEGLAVTEKTENAIKSALDSKRLSHALILEGADESTREQCAKILAAAVLCTGEGKPCGGCNACRKVMGNNHPDVHILKKDDTSAMIKVDSVRRIKAQALVYPNEGSKSVFIICEAQLMNTQAQNALLKIFEEPSDYVCFILTCESKSSLLETIVSRGTAYLLSESGAMTGERESTPAREKAAELMESLCSESEVAFLRRTAVFQKNKQLFRDVLDELIPILRDAIVLQSGGKVLISGCDTTARKLKNALTQRQTAMMLEKISALRDNVLSSGNHNLQITRFSAVLYSIMKG